MRRAAIALTATALLAGCGSDRPEPIADATQLEQNIPTDIGGVRVIAVNIEDGTGVVSVDGERTQAAVGEEITIGGSTYEVVQVVGDGAEEGPDGWISIREEEQ